MSATSGIPVSPDLASKFSAASAQGSSVRFLKISIQSETLVHDTTEQAEGSLQDDLARLDGLLEDDVPAYVLARLDEHAGQWLAIFYVPDSAKVRDKMLYASTRASLLKSLGSAAFPDTLFATAKADLTPAAYAAHRRHTAAPQPLSAREQELADIRAAERADASAPSYEGSRARASHVGGKVGLKWTGEVEEALRALGEGEGARLVLLSIDSTETLVLDSVSETSADSVGTAIPASEPSFAFYAWPHAHSTPPKRDIIFIYSCPSASPVKSRMLYSSSARALYHEASKLLPASALAQRKIETSDPAEIDEAFLGAELGYGASAVGGGEESREGVDQPQVREGQKFARPRGPARRVR